VAGSDETQRSLTAATTLNVVIPRRGRQRWSVSGSDAGPRSRGPPPESKSSDLQAGGAFFHSAHTSQDFLSWVPLPSRAPAAAAGPASRGMTTFFWNEAGHLRLAVDGRRKRSSTPLTPHTSMTHLPSRGEVRL